MSLLKQLHIRLSLSFLLLVVIAAVAFLALDLRNNNQFHQEVTQQLHRNLADYIVEHQDQPLFDRLGHANREAMAHIALQVMAINPSVEVYLLDPHGQILAHALPQQTVLRGQVALQPLLTLLQPQHALPLLGDDPRSQTGQRIFSVARIRQQNQLQGYLYVVLAGREYQGVVDALSHSAILKRGLLGGLALAGVLVTSGVVIFVMLTRPLRRLSQKIATYRGCDTHALTDIHGDDLSQLEQTFDAMQARIEQQFKRIQHNDQLRRELISNISHDLHTPLASVQGYIETLLTSNGNLPAAEQQQHLQVALRHSRMLSKRIGELFELAKLDDGRVTLNLETFALDELLNDVVQSYRLEALKRGIILSLQPLPHQTLQVTGDIALIERVLQNLIDNALRYTPGGGTVRLLIVADGLNVKVVVEDTGIGIPANDLPLIFERYFRAESHKSSSEAGTGLGLAIVKRILDLHGSLVDVASQYGQGTQISFALPLAAKPIY